MKKIVRPRASGVDRELIGGRRGNPAALTKRGPDGRDAAHLP